MNAAANRLSALWCLILFALEIICFQFYTFCFGSTALAAVMALLVFIIGFAAVSLFAAFRTSKKDQTGSGTEESEQAGQPQNDGGQ